MMSSLYSEFGGFLRGGAEQIGQKLLKKCSKIYDTNLYFNSIIITPSIHVALIMYFNITIITIIPLLLFTSYHHHHHDYHHQHYHYHYHNHPHIHSIQSSHYHNCRYNYHTTPTIIAIISSPSQSQFLDVDVITGHDMSA